MFKYVVLYTKSYMVSVIWTIKICHDNVSY